MSGHESDSASSSGSLPPIFAKPPTPPPVVITYTPWEKANALMWASAIGLLGDVERWLEEGADVNAYDYEGRSAVHYAAANRHKEILKLLLQQPGLELSKTSRFARTPLCIEAVRKGDYIDPDPEKQDDPSCFKMLLEEGMDATLENGNGHNCLSIAAMYGYKDIIRAIMRVGRASAPTFRNLPALRRKAGFKKLTAEGWADFSEQWTVAGLLRKLRYTLEKEEALRDGPSPSPKARRKRPSAPIEEAAKAATMQDQVLVVAAPEAGTPQSAADKLLLHAAKHALGDEVARALDELHADPNATDRNGQTAAHHAAWNRSLPILQLLSKFDADMTVVSKFGFTPLLASVCAGTSVSALPGDDPACCAHLVAVGGQDPTQRNFAGHTPLSLAAYSGFPTIIKYLLSIPEVGNLGHMDTIGGSKTAEQWAAHMDHAEVMAVFKAMRDYLEEEAIPVSKPAAVPDRVLNLKTSKLLAGSWAWREQHRIDLELLAACKFGHLDAAVAALEDGADYNAWDSAGQTSLHHACWERNADIVKVLLEQPGVDVKAPTHRGADVFVAAIGRGAIAAKHDRDNPDCLRLLVEAGGVDISVPTVREETGLMLAATYGYGAIVSYMLSLPEVRTMEHLRQRGGCWQRTASEWAHKEGHVEVGMLLDDALAECRRKREEAFAAKLLAAEQARAMLVAPDLGPLRTPLPTDDDSFQGHAFHEPQRVPELEPEDGKEAAGGSGGAAAAAATAEDILAKEKAGPNQGLLRAAKNNSPGEARTALAAGADINCRDRLGETPAHLAARRRHAAVLEVIASTKGVDLDLTEPNSGDCIAMSAVRKPLRSKTATVLDREKAADLVDTLDVLLNAKYGAPELRARNNMGHTMLTIAATNGYLPIVERLTQQESLANTVYIHMAAGAGKRSAAQWAAIKGHAAVHDLLQQWAEDVAAEEFRWANRSNPTASWSMGDLSSVGSGSVADSVEESDIPGEPSRTDDLLDGDSG